MRKKKLLLFVWTDFCPDYTSGLACALAGDLAEAQEMVKKQTGYDPTWGDLHVHEVSQPIAYAVHGGG